MAKAEWLDRATIDKVVEGMSTADLIEASGETISAKQAGVAFNAAAKRQGISNGTPATQSVRARDFLYLAEKMGEIMGPDSPKSDDTEDSPDSADSGA